MFGENYLIGNQAGKEIFKAIRSLPVLDAHNHADVAALDRNEPFPNLWSLFAATDHYVWEIMRKCGIAEEFITGSASDHDKFIKLADHFEEMIGNPVYEWIHLDLRALGIDSELNAENGEKIWKEGMRLLALPEYRPLAILKRLNVEAMCSTDDPADDLKAHVSVNRKLDGAVTIRPTWRPDKAMKIQAAGFAEYIGKLGACYQTEIRDMNALLTVLAKSHDFFAEQGCAATDHGLELAPSGVGDRKLADAALKKALSGEKLTADEAANYLNFMMGEFAELNAQKGWVTQLHMGAVRDVRAKIFNTLGPDAGGDISSLVQDYTPNLITFLNRFDDRLKVVLYSLDPAQYPTLATLARAFGSKVRLGSAWWLLDTPVGMKRQLEYIGSVDLLSAFAGMVSDSRKLLSYGSRFEMFRRVLSDVLGSMVEREQFQLKSGIKLAVRMAYDGPKELFRF